MKPYFLLLILSTLLTACTGLQKSPADKPTALDVPNAQQIQILLKEAQNSASPQRENKLLQAAGLMLEEGRRDLTEQTLGRIQTTSLPYRLFAVYTEVSCELHIQQGQFEQARTALEAERLQDTFDTLPLDQQITLSLLRAEVYALLGSHIASAQQRIYINPLLDPENQSNNREAIWTSLMQVSGIELSHYQATSVQGEYLGWLNLALIAKNNQGDLDEQVRQLDNWESQWPQHPANGHLPGGLELIQELAANRPQHIALLLPLTGRLAPFGKAIRDGFIAALYETMEHGGQVPKLDIYDTEAHEDFLMLYQNAINQGAEMIVGPLEKQRLSLLFDYGNLPVPTLSLNRINDYGKAPDQLFQFGLVPQDEARQIAEIAFLENKREAYIISPKGEWGDKVSKAFSDHWEILGGNTVTRTRYEDSADYSNNIKQALLLQASEDRAKRIARLTSEKLEFSSPRRRKDVDMVFLLARPQQARSIKPLLDYHYAGGLPIYGTSHLYTGYTDTRKDRDIEGIRFTDMPWVLNTPSILHQQINAEIEQSKQYQRMYALGIDSYQLHPRLRQLQAIPGSRVFGFTGTLKLNEHREIERRMLFAKINRNRAKVIPTAALTVDLDIPKEGIYVEEQIHQRQEY
ncbi:MAG: penicillin-binding protein activator [Oceanicoccus sp.]